MKRSHKIYLTLKSVSPSYVTSPWYEKIVSSQEKFPYT